MMKKYKSIAFPLSIIFVFLLGPSQLFAQNEKIITVGIQNPYNNGTKNFYRTDDTEPVKVNNQSSQMTPFIKYRKVFRKEYFDVGIYLDMQKTHNYSATKPDANNTYTVEQRFVKTNIPYLEVGKGLKYPVKKSFITVGLNGFAGYEYKPKLTDVRSDYNSGSFAVRDITTRQESPRFVRLGISSDFSYNQRITDQIYAHIEPKIRYRYSFSVRKPYRETTTVVDGTETNISSLEYVEYDRKFSDFQFLPSFGIAVKF